MMSTTVPQLSVRGALAIVIGHELGPAWTIADRVLIMHRARIVEDGPVEQILLDPRHDDTRLLLKVSELGLHRD
jgi:ABC-type dipeptide/oligopeptide/nickel transport system ATPase component